MLDPRLGEHYYETTRAWENDAISTTDFYTQATKTTTIGSSTIVQFDVWPTTRDSAPATATPTFPWYWETQSTFKTRPAPSTVTVTTAAATSSVTW